MFSFKITTEHHYIGTGFDWIVISIMLFHCYFVCIYNIECTLKYYCR